MGAPAAPQPPEPLFVGGGTVTPGLGTRDQGPGSREQGAGTVPPGATEPPSLESSAQPRGGTGGSLPLYRTVPAPGVPGGWGGGGHAAVSRCPFPEGHRAGTTQRCRPPTHRAGGTKPPAPRARGPGPGDVPNAPAASPGPELGGWWWWWGGAGTGKSGTVIQRGAGCRLARAPKSPSVPVRKESIAHAEPHTPLP